MSTPLLGFDELAPLQDAPDETVNETFRDLELFANLRIADRDLSTPPGGPAESDCYLVKAAGLAAWSGHDNEIAWWRGGIWKFADPYEGLMARVLDENVLIVYDGAAWVSTSAGGLLAANNLSDVANAATAGANLRTIEALMYACSDETTAITAGNGKLTFRMPYAFTLTAIRASVTTAPTGSTIIIDVNEAGASILSTKLSIDATEKTSVTAATPAVISDASLADDAEITVDFDQVGSTIAGAGVKLYLIGHRT